MKTPIALNLTILIGLIIFLLSTTISLATNYYVDRNHSSASDSNPGTLNSPWLTIQHAAETIVAGDTVFIRTGVYNENVYLENDGNGTDGYIILSAYPGEIPVIDGAGVSDADNGVIIDKSYIKLIGFEIRNWNENGIWIENAAHLEISDCKVYDVYYGIGVADGTHDFEFNRVETYHFSLYGFDVSPSGGDDCYNGTFNDCISHSGRDPEQNVDGFALGHGTQHDFTFNRCVTYEVYDGFDISSKNSTLNRCLAYNCWNGGYKLWQDNVKLVNCIGYNSSGSIVELDWDEQPGTTSLINCTFFNGETYTIWVENPGDKLRMYNCILAGGDNIGLAFEQMGVSNYEGDYNIFHNDNPYRAVAVAYTDEFSLDQITSGDWTTYSGQDAHSLVESLDGNLFVNASNFDLHIIENSLAVDHGKSDLAPPIDFDGNPRPSGNDVDIGAYEYQFPVGIDLHDGGKYLPTTIKLFHNYPNPFNLFTHIYYQINKPAFVEMKIYNLNGEIIRRLIGQDQSPGQYDVQWDGNDVYGNRASSGQYLCQLKVANSTDMIKLILLK
ncbi:MAG: T9SS type A sorting domain-containing protein [Candidatus Aminicenantes bacterium]|nr:T9SS type A sorting domain-containing protein [Candidatus Aminicenantes bacterium]